MSFIEILLYLVAAAMCVSNGLGVSFRFWNGWIGLGVAIFTFGVLGHIHIG